MNIDWSKCPQATHFAPKPADDEMWCEVFWRVVDGVGVEAWSIVDDGLQHYSRPTWREATAERLIARPSPWNGEGLPPVGTYLEAGFAYEEFATWHKGLCIAVGEDPEGREDFCVVQFGRKIAMYSAEEKRMRPIRTAEQIAADERAAAIEEIRQLLLSGANGSIESVIYDAGYRKQVQP